MAEIGEAVVSAKELRVSYGAGLLLDGVGVALHEGERVGVVGRNGAGKSTLLRILAGALQPDSGEVSPRRGLTVGYLPQEHDLDPGKTVEETVMEGARAITALITEYEAMVPDDARAGEWLARIERVDGWGLDHRIKTAMRSLSTPAGDRSTATLSGGERRRVALCRAIIARPDLLVLDEPTNHLDAESIGWLEEYLCAFAGTALFVTHDRHFLDRVATRMVEVSHGRLYSYPGNYGAFLEAQAARVENEGQAERRRMSFVRRELDWIRRGPKARTTKSKSRVDRFYEAANQSGPPRERDVELVIPPASASGNRLVELERATLELGGRVLFSDFDLVFEPGARVGIVGRNGLGKTCLLRVVMGEMPLTSGKRVAAVSASFNYVDQDRAQLREDRTVYDEVGQGSEFVQIGEQRISVRAYLRRFLFPEDRILQPVGKLSGGEKNRVLLARLLKRGGNFLVMDEPTNDLDLATLRVLEESLDEFGGCLAVVSHDRYFLDRVCTRIVGFEGDGRVTVSEGGCERYFAGLAARRQAEVKLAAPPAKAPAPRKAPVQARKLSFKEVRELEGMEGAILAAEQEVGRLEDLFAQPDFHRAHGRDAGRLLSELGQAQERVAALYARWGELEAIRDACE